MTTFAAIRSNGSATTLEATSTNAVLLSYIENLVEQRLVEPREDLIGLLIKEQLVPRHLKKEDVV